MSSMSQDAGDLGNLYGLGGVSSLRRALPIRVSLSGYSPRTNTSLGRSFIDKERKEREVPPPISGIQSEPPYGELSPTGITGRRKANLAFDVLAAQTRSSTSSGREAAG